MAKKIKVVHLITSLETGGAQAVLAEIVSGLDKRKFEHHIIFFHSGYYEKVFKKLGIKMYRIVGVVMPYDPVFLYRLYKTIKDLNPTCLHTLLWSANFCGKIIGWLLTIPTVQVFHNTADHNGLLRNVIDRVVTFKPTSSVAISNSVKSSFAKRIPWMGNAMDIIKNGIDQGVVRQKAQKEVKTRRNLKLLKKHFVIGTVGRFEYVKNYSLLLTSFALLYDDFPNARLVLLGEGNQEKFLRQRAIDLGIEDRVIFVVGKSAYGYYHLFDCFVQSSFSEGLSMALLEAATLGIAPVVTSHNGHHDLVIDGINGQLALSGDAYALARALVFFMRYPDKKDAMAQRVQADVEACFQAKSMVLNYGQIYTRLADQKRA